MFQFLLIYLFIFIFIFHIIFYHKYNLPKYIKKIEKIPGPKGVFYFGNILRFYQLKTEDMLPHVMKEFETWGPTLKYWYSGIAIVLISGVDDVQTVLSSKLNYGKGLMYDHLKPWLGTGLLTSEGDKWRLMRKIITPTFHFSILQEYIQVFSKNSKIMMGLLDKEKNKDECDVGTFITYCALDSICETSMGKCINAQTTRSENKYVRAILRMGQIVVERLFSPFLYTDHMFNLSPLGKENTELLKILHGTTSKVNIKMDLIQERKQLHLSGSLDYGNDEENARKKIHFLDLLIEKQKIHYFTDSDLRQEVDTVLMAGHDTTATALSWCLFELGFHDEIQEKIYQELQTIFEDSDREPVHQDVLKMEYLKRVLQETLRLYPSVPVISRKFKVDIQLKDYLIPANTDIVLVLYCIHRNPKVFPDPEKFDPDRFLPENIKDRNPFAYVPFSAGSRNCLGQKYATLQMMVIASSILRKYKVITLTPKKLVKPVPDVILRPNIQLKWKLIPRTFNSKTN